MSINEKPKYIVRELRFSDCEEVRKLGTELGFLMTKYQNEILLKIDPKGVFVAQEVISGKLLGVCCGINVSDKLAFIGAYGVKPECQGWGIGSAIWQKVMDHIGSDRNISLYSRPEMMAKYRDKSHIRIIPEKSLLHFTGKVNCNELIGSIEGISLVSINEDNIHKVIQYDKQVCDGLDRTVLIEEIAKTSDRVNLVAINEKHEVLGYCVICVTILKTCLVEPLYADNERIAELLIGKCCQLLPNTGTDGLAYLCWDTNTKSISIAKRLGLKQTLKQPILFSKRLIDGKLDQIFCVSSRCSYPF